MRKNVENLILKPILIEPCDMYIALMFFLENYNQSAESIDIKCLKSEIGQPHLAQGTYRLWLTTLRDVLLNFGLLEKNRNFNNRILPEYINIDSYKGYQAVMRFLENYNENLQSEDLRKLIKEMETAPTLFDTWKLSLNRACSEAEESKE